MGATFSPPIQETQIVPEIAPMRRGRPGKPQSSTHSSARPSPSPYRGGSKNSASDPFAALDGGARKKTADELSKRFPTLDQFDILHEKGDKFDFKPTVKEPKSEDEGLSQRLTIALADEAFARRSSPEQQELDTNRRSQASPVRRPNPQEIPVRQSAPLYQPTPKRPAMVSTGTMTSPSQTPQLQEPKLSTRPIYRFPASEEQRPSSLPWDEEEQKKGPSPPSSRLRLEASPRLVSDRLSNQSNSARPSMETLRRSSGLETNDPLGRSKSAIAKPRPVSIHSGAQDDLRRDSEASRSSLDLSLQYEDGVPLRTVRTEVDREHDQGKISSELDYLRAKEEESNRKREKRSSGGSKHAKRGSLSSLSFSGSKTLFAGRFGEAFRRFESSNQDKPSTPSAEDPQQQQQQALISASDALDADHEEFTPYDEADLDNVDRDDISPEMRRELERRRLSQEEKRVANAAAEYRRRVADHEGGGKAGADGPRSRVIQNRVQNLLGESSKPPIAPKTASGYGRYTDTSALPAKQGDITSSTSGTVLPISRAPAPVHGARGEAMAPPDRREGASAPAGLPQSAASTSTGYSSGPRPASRPVAPPKPKNLRVGAQDASRPGTGHDRSTSFQPTPASPGDDWETNFSRRFPSLSGLEVETEIEIPKYPKVRTWEV